MNSRTHPYSLLFAYIAVALLVAVPLQSALGQTKAEKVFAELAKLDPAERKQRILEGAREEGELVFVMGIRGKLGQGHTRLFKKRYPFLDVKVAEMGSNDAAERLIAEETAGRHLTDLLSSVSFSDMTAVVAKGIPARYSTPAAKNILPQYRAFIDEKRGLLPTHWSERGMSHNTKMLPIKDAPKTYKDLCNPQYKGQFSFDPNRARDVIFMYKIFGENDKKLVDYLKCLGANEPILQKGQTQRLMLMLAGDHAIQGTNFFYKGTKFHRKNPEKAPFRAIYSAHVMATPAGAIINRNAPHPFATALYVDWALSKEAQSYLAKQFRGPVAQPHPFLPDGLKLVAITAEDPNLVKRLQDYWKKYVARKK